MRPVLLLGGVLCVAASWPSARAEQPPDPSLELELIESTEQGEDPLGLDRATGSELNRAADRLPKASEPLPSAQRGEGLSAIDGVSERAHAVHVELALGLAFVRSELTFGSSAKHAAELAYRLPLPAGAVLTRVAICAARACRLAEPESAPSAHARSPADSSLPALDGELIEDERGRALALRISALAPAAELSVQVSYVSEAPVRGGRSRFTLPARGYDPRLAATLLHVQADELELLSPRSDLRLDPWQAYEISAQLKADVRRSSSASCGSGSCRRAFEARVAGAPDRRTTWLFIDASPSMEGPARSRAGVTLAALLNVLDPATELRAWAFGARALELGRYRADEAPLGALADAALQELDAATYVSSAVQLARRDLVRDKPRIVLLSDGLFDPSPRERAALDRTRQAGAELWLIALGDVEPRLADAFDGVVRLAALAELALRNDQLAPLEEAVRVVTQPRRDSRARPGEQRVEEQRPRAPFPLRGDAHWLAFWLAHASPTRWSSARAQARPAALKAIPYLSLSAPPAPPDTGLPKESVLSMLRTQLVPQARACLRSDRKGRGDYAVELTFHALFAQRETYDARVEGAVSPALRACLEALLPRLRVPAFSGSIRVRYPIHTEREAPPPVLELGPDLTRQLDRALRPARALP